MEKKRKSRKIKWKYRKEACKTLLEYLKFSNQAKPHGLWFPLGFAAASFPLSWKMRVSRCLHVCGEFLGPPLGFSSPMIPGTISALKANDFFFFFFLNHISAKNQHLCTFWGGFEIACSEDGEAKAPESEVIIRNVTLMWRQGRWEEWRGTAWPRAPMSVSFFHSIISSLPLIQNPGSSSFPENSGVALLIS